ncbi:aromatic amino acid lyase [Streptomyces sp. SID5464]|nr:aromatic amino acid lyase [Streptomyces sp. SID5464]
MRDLLERSTAPLEPTAAEQDRMAAAHRTLAGLDGSRRVYGVTHGFGPLVDHAADPDPARQGAGLVSHLATGPGDPLPPDVTRTMVRLRLRGMALRHSAVAPRTWQRLADLVNAGFVPVVPSEGTLCDPTPARALTPPTPTPGPPPRARAAPPRCDAVARLTPPHPTTPPVTSARPPRRTPPRPMEEDHDRHAPAAAGPGPSAARMGLARRTQGRPALPGGETSPGGRHRLRRPHRRTRAGRPG